MSDIVTLVLNMLVLHEQKEFSMNPTFYDKLFLQNIDYFGRVVPFLVCREANEQTFQQICVERNLLSLNPRLEIEFQPGKLFISIYDVVPPRIFEQRLLLKDNLWISQFLNEAVDMPTEENTPRMVYTILQHYLHADIRNVTRYMNSNIEALNLEQIPVLFERFGCKIISKQHLMTEMGATFVELYESMRRDCELPMVVL